MKIINETVGATISERSDADLFKGSSIKFFIRNSLKQVVGFENQGTAPLCRLCQSSDVLIRHLENRDLCIV